MPTTYPLDLTGGALTNQIANELHTFASSADRIFPLSAGPFYTIGLTVRHGVTNDLLQPVTQYKALQLHRDASLISGKEVCAVIIVEDATVPSVRISYQCIGGIYSGEASLIQDLIANNPLPLGPVVWGQIIGIPVQFPPTEHLHHIDNIYGAEELVAVLERMRMAIAAGDSPAIAAIYQYIHTLLTNLNFQTEQQVIDLIGDTAVQYVKTYDSYAQLRTETNVINNESYLYIATGKAARNDRKGRMFMWDITSMAVDDNDKVLRPDHILETNPGRFIAMLDVELDLKNALATLGRRIETNGTVNADLGVVNRIESVSMNSLITPGDYWIHSNCTGRPDNTETLALKVWRESDTVIGQQAQCLYSTENYPHNRQGITYSRVSLDGGATWSEWHETFTVARAVANGLDVDLATTNTTNADLNTLIRTGKYWFGNTNANRPEYNPGLYMEYAQLEVVCLNSSDVMQRAFNTSLEAYRYGYGGGAYAGHSWTTWEFRAARNGDTTQAFAMYSYPIGTIDPTHGVNAGFLATQFATLWARLTANGIDAVLGTTNVIPDTTNLNAVLAVGKYYYGTSPNNPFPYALLEVEAFSGAFVIQTAYDMQRRAGRCTYDGGATWTPWVFNQNLDIQTESSLNGLDLNDAVWPGDYYYTPTSSNAPTAYGLVHVRRESVFIVYQQAQSADNRLFTRYLTNGFGWLPWVEYATQSQITTLSNAVTALASAHTYTDTVTYFDSPSLYYWVVPAGVTSLIISLCAGGGGGGQGGGNDTGSEIGGGGGGGASGQWAVLKIDNVVPGGVVVLFVGAGGYGGYGSSYGGSTGDGADGSDSAVTVATSFGTETYVVKGGKGGGKGGWGDDNGSDPAHRGAGGILSTYVNDPTIFTAISRSGQTPGVGGGQTPIAGPGGVIIRPGGSTVGNLTGDGGNGSQGNYGWTSGAAPGSDGGDGRIAIYW